MLAETERKPLGTKLAMKFIALIRGSSCAIALSLSLSLYSQSYDLARDFSVASNPRGVWSYGYAAAIGGSYSNLLVARTNEAPIYPIWSWSYNGFQSPDAHFNAGTNTFTDG